MFKSEPRCECIITRLRAHAKLGILGLGVDRSIPVRGVIFHMQCGNYRRDMKYYDRASGEGKAKTCNFAQPVVKIRPRQKMVQCARSGKGGVYPDR